jgi:hypothetical protein
MSEPVLTVAAPAPTDDSPPRELGAAGRQLWNQILAEYSIADRAGREILCLAAEATDRAAQLAAQIDETGSVIQTRNGPRANPALRDELANRAFVARSLQRLGVLSEPIKPVGRPTRGW